jgi:hypothetical protein
MGLYDSVTFEIASVEYTIAIIDTLYVSRANSNLPNENDGGPEVSTMR